MNKAELQERLGKYFTPDGVPTKGGLVIREEEVAYTLYMLAKLDEPCGLPAHLCDHCNMFYTFWWGTYNDLDHRIGRRLQQTMHLNDVPLPPAPSEVIPTNAVPTARG